MDYLICGQKQHSQRSPLNVLIIPYFMILFPYSIYFVTDTKRVLLRLRYVSFAWIDCISTAIACKTIFTYLTICYLMVVKPTELLRLGIEPSLREFTELPQTSSLLPAIYLRIIGNRITRTVAQLPIHIRREVQYEYVPILEMIFRIVQNRQWLVSDGKFHIEFSVSNINVRIYGCVHHMHLL